MSYAARFFIRSSKYRKYATPCSRFDTSGGGNIKTSVCAVAYETEGWLPRNCYRCRTFWRRKENRLKPALPMNLDSGSPPGMTNFGPSRAARCVLAREISRSEPDNLLRLPEIVTDGYRGAGDHERGLVSVNGIQFGERPTRHICADPHLIRSAKSDFHLIQLA